MAMLLLYIKHFQIKYFNFKQKFSKKKIIYNKIFKMIAELNKLYKLLI